MTVSSSINRVSYNGNGSTTVFAYTFKVFDQDDLTVIIRAPGGTETVQTLNTDYTVSGLGLDGGGNVTFGTPPAIGDTVVIIREQPLVQELDLVPNDPFPADVLESALDRLTFMVQQHEETLGRTIKASRTNTLVGSEFTISAANRANKIFAFDSAGDVSIVQELGSYRGDWVTARAFAERDIVKDTTTNNIFIALVPHTSTGALPITTNADAAKWALLVDSASATASAAAASASAIAAAASEVNAAASEVAAGVSEVNAAASEAAAALSEANVANLFEDFDTRYLGAKSSDPTLDNDGNALIDGALYFDTANNVLKVYDLGTTAWLRTTPTSGDQANINAVTAIAADVTTVAGISTEVVSVSAISADVSAVSAIDTDVTTVAGISGDVVTVAANVSGVNSFAERYRVGTADPTDSLDEGDLFYNTSSNLLKVYNGTVWETGVTPGSGFLSASNNLSDLDDPETAVNNLKIIIRAPVITSPTEGQTGVLTQPTIEGSVYAPIYSVDARDFRQFQVDVATGDFSDPVVDEQINADDFTLTTPLATDTDFKVRIRDVSVAGAQSEFSPVVAFKTTDISVNEPTLTVEGSPSDVPEAPTLTTSAFDTTPTGEDTHAATDWEVRKTTDNSLVYSSLNDTVNLLSIVVPAGNLEEDTEYLFRARHIGTIYGAGPFAEVTASTVASFAPTVFGQAFGGGFYAGNIVQGGDEYYIILAPKSSGESSNLQYKTNITASPSATRTLNNGSAATAAMVSAGSHPAADFCAGLTIGGFSDWYLPARDELELCYRNLKPQTNTNDTSNRGKSSITYPEGDDLSADTMGVNRNSNPTGPAYISGTPSQTSNTDFKDGGTEAMSGSFYWSSSEFSNSAAWRQRFLDGFQLSDEGFAGKDDPAVARAVRRIAI